MKIATIMNHLKAIEQAKQDGMEQLAIILFNTTIKPLLERRGLGYTTMNGCPSVYDINGDQKPMPKVMEKYFNIYDESGGPLYYWYPEYNPHKQNFSDNDIKAFNKRPKQPLCAYIFSPAFASLR